MFVKHNFSNKKSLSIAVTIIILIVSAVGIFAFDRAFSYTEKSRVDVAMGAVVSVKTYGSKKDGIEENIIEQIKILEKNTLTNKNELSLIGQANKNGSVALDEKTENQIDICLDVFAYTKGKAALTVGNLSSLWDFGGENQKVPSKEEINSALASVNDKSIKIENHILYIGAGQKLDLGSVGKGAACDKAALILKENDVKNAVVSVGGSIFAKGDSRSNTPMKIGVRNPYGAESEYFGVISTICGFISTSGNYEKTFTENGKTYHHLLDCTTGYPVENGLCSVTVYCQNGILSDALSTACFVMGYGEDTLNLLNEYGADAIFVFENKQVFMTSGLSDCFELTDSSFTVKTI